MPQHQEQDAADAEAPRARGDREQRDLVAARESALLEQAVVHAHLGLDEGETVLAGTLVDRAHAADDVLLHLGPTLGVGAVSLSDRARMMPLGTPSMSATCENVEMERE